MDIYTNFLMLNSIALCAGSLYDPHVFPQGGPFFEGWYMRFTDSDKNRTFGVLFGKVLPDDEAKASKLVFTGLLYDDHSTPGLQSYNAFPPPSLLNLTVGDGRQVSRDPTVAGPPHFRWDVGRYGYIEVTPEVTLVNVTADGVRFEAHVTGSVPWDPDHVGPQGWLRRLPFTPLFWFVYSVRSPVASYSWTHLDAGDVISGTSGLAHMEKNWGDSFPEAWIWTQGVRTDNVSYAIAFGPVSFGPITLQGHLGGYKNPKKNIDISFRPDNSYMVYSLEACSGSIQVTIETFTYKLEFCIAANRSTFSCLYGPMQNGFRKVCSESFKATAEINVFERGLFRNTLVDSQTINISALEFGGLFMCKGMC